MRKLKLQMAFDGLDWDDDMVTFCVDNLKDVDTILLGSKTAEEFIPYWAEYANNSVEGDMNTPLGKPLTDTPKLVFSNRQKAKPWVNTTIVEGDSIAAIQDLKKQPGKDMIVYGGHSFVTSLVEHNLVDEYYLLVNPLTISPDDPVLKIVKNKAKLTLKDCKPFPSGSVLLVYTK